MEKKLKNNQQKPEIDQYGELLIFEFSDWRLSQLADKIKNENFKPKFKTINF